MRKRAGDQNGNAEGGKKRFQLTMFGGIVLVGMLALLFKTKTGAESVLFNKNSEITLYAKTAVGAEPALNAAKFFPDERLDPAKFSYDLSACDFNTPGLYRIPVFYGKDETDCVIQLEVLASVRDMPGTSSELSGDFLSAGTGETEGE